MKKVVKLTESDLIRLIKKVIKESEDKDIDKFDAYAIEQFTKKGFKKDNDKKYTKWDWSIEYKYYQYPTYGIDGFVAKYNNIKKYDGPADDCWEWFQKQKF